MSFDFKSSQDALPFLDHTPTRWEGEKAFYVRINRISRVEEDNKLRYSSVLS